MSIASCFALEKELRSKLTLPSCKANLKFCRTSIRSRISLNEVTSNHIQRGIIAVALEQGKLEESTKELEEISQLASENLDRQYMAFIQSYYLYLYTMQNNIPCATAAYTKALDLFERLGMRREAQKVRTTLNGINQPHTNRLELLQLP